MARRYKPSPNEMSAAHIERAAKQARQTAMYADVSLRAEQIGLAKVDADEQRAAALAVIDLAAQHPCQLDPENGVTVCDDPFHAPDVEALRELLDAFGLLPAVGPNETWLSAAQAARMLGISEGAVRSRVRKGRLRGAVIGRQRSLRIDPDQVRRLTEGDA